MNATASGPATNLNENALYELFQHSTADFSNGEVELYDVVGKALADEKDLLLTLVARIAQNDLYAPTELRLLLSGIAAQKNLEMASCH